MRPAEGLIIDLDGTLYVGDRVIAGAPQAVAAVRAAGIRTCFATNTTRSARTDLVERLARLGIELTADELFTAPVAAARWLAERGARRLSLLLPEVAWREFAGFERDDETPDHVVIGDLGEAWSYAVLDRAFRALRHGAGLVALHKNRAWDPGDGLRLDAGPFVAALEYATDRSAIVVGKPSRPFFATAAASLGVPRSRIAVVGDSLDNDVRGGQRAGCLGVAVRTGSFRAEQLTALRRPPDAVLASIAELPDWLGIAADG